VTGGPGVADAPAGAATMTCRVCHVEVPAGAFCGLCGASDQLRPGDGPDWLRRYAFGAAPGEHLFRPWLASSLFPHLSPRSRGPFRMALIAVLALLVAFAVLRMPACLIAVGSLGMPLLFVAYMYESDARRDFPLTNLVLAVAVGVGLGVGWVLVTGELVARSYGVPLQGGLALSRLLREGLGIPVASTVLLTLPAVVVRLTKPSSRESLDGFVIGAVGAVSFAAAATLTQLVPQLAVGLINHNRSLFGLLVEAGIRGWAVPLSAMAAGGLIGAAMWFKRPPGKPGQRAARVPVTLAAFGAGILGVHLLLGLVDVKTVPQWFQLACHLLLALTAVMLLRVGLHLALLHEARGGVMSDQVILCPHCGNVVPDMAFCPACGVAERASSRSSRAARRQHRPVSGPSDDAAIEMRPGYAVAPGSYAVLPTPCPPPRRVLGSWGVALAAVALLLGGLSVAITKPPVRYACPPNCGKPPTGKPIETNPRYTAADGSFSVSYPAPGSAYRITRNPRGVTAELLVGDGGKLQLLSVPAAGRSPRRIADDLVKKTYPDARVAYTIPNAMVGYEPGYGEVADFWPQGAHASFMRMRLMVVVAVKDDLALVAGAVGPYREFGPDFGPGLPSGANLEIAGDMGKYVNSFTWRGDPPR
jgi:RsiW-degrading membrane proteinase PrsW (M82 family)